jgi:hypothetical protein
VAAEAAAVAVAAAWWRQRRWRRRWRRRRRRRVGARKYARSTHPIGGVRASELRASAVVRIAPMSTNFDIILRESGEAECDSESLSQLKAITTF